MKKKKTSEPEYIRAEHGGLIEYVVQHTAKTMGLRYHFERWQTANVILDKGAFPVLINVLPLNGTVVIRAGKYFDRQRCVLAFLDKTELDFTGYQNQYIVERMKSLAVHFLAHLKGTGAVNVADGEISYDIPYDKLDVATTGVILYVTLETPAKCLPVECPEWSTFTHVFDSTFQSPAPLFSNFARTFDNTFKE